VQRLSRRQLFGRAAALAAAAGSASLAGAALASGPGELAPPSTDAGELPNLKFSFASAHTRVTAGGWAREVTVRDLPVAKAIAGVDMRLKPGAIRELHWHSAAEWALMLAGGARITAVDAEGRNFVADVAEGDLWFFPAGIPQGAGRELRRAAPFIRPHPGRHRAEALHLPRQGPRPARVR
jgi:oxalate decarboxylase family bicupin protein